ncbi:hypothetical protein [Microbacterium sp. No. 7]|uniref:hypothetical protein n=1 Tax=Microbacterium sp. No. 7 TaxID=1714373 RepID=UPI0012E1D071|nr:hypothetical protein [Microbacterium sp. No. 7]
MSRKATSRRGGVDPNGASRIDRRGLVRGSAWSMPAVTATAVIPMSTATEPSPTCRPGHLKVEAAHGSLDRTEAPVAIPACMTNVRFVMHGGGGPPGDAVHGPGSVVEGELELAAGRTGDILLTLVADGTGSAILVAGVPVVVAGAGGGDAGSSFAGGSADVAVASVTITAGSSQAPGPSGAAGPGTVEVWWS